MRILWHVGFAMREEPMTSERDRPLVRLSRARAAEQRSSEIPILKIFLGRCVAVLCQP
jgi:hypothetical protein